MVSHGSWLQAGDVVLACGGAGGLGGQLTMASPSKDSSPPRPSPAGTERQKESSGGTQPLPPPSRLPPNLPLPPPFSLPTTRVPGLPSAPALPLLRSNATHLPPLKLHIHRALCTSSQRTPGHAEFPYGLPFGGHWAKIRSPCLGPHLRPQPPKSPHCH